MLRAVDASFQRWPSGRVDPRFVLDPFEPAYVRLRGTRAMAARVARAHRALEDCCACPRQCHVNRLRNETKVCHTGRHARVASAFAHLGEEACLRGWNGSGTIFFGWCNLRCVFCQNWDISQTEAGDEVPAAGIARVMLALQDRGCHNINLVTPEHVVPQVVEAIAEAVAQGLHLPIVYNTSGYDSVESIRLLQGIVDIYMPDFKFWNATTARRLAKADDYPDRAREAIREMHRQVGPLMLGPTGLARRGVLVRHLVLPGLVDESAAIFNWLATELSPDTYVNVMGQYRPHYRVSQVGPGGWQGAPELCRPLAADERAQADAAARHAGLWRFAEQ